MSASFARSKNRAHTSRHSATRWLGPFLFSRVAHCVAVPVALGERKMKKLQIIVPLFVVALAGCVGPGRPPHAFLPPIAEEYYVCEKCDSLHGGIYGKGPLASFSTSSGSKCWHRWHQIPRAEFQRLASDRFPAEWEKTGWYVKRAEAEPLQPPQHKAGSRPSSNDSPASQTPSSLGPRGWSGSFGKA